MQANVSDQAALAKSGSRRNASLKLRQRVSFGTWNVRRLLQVGKLYILERDLMREKMREKIDVCGIAKTYWKGQGHFETEDLVIYVSGQRERTGNSRLAILVSEISKSVEGPISDRLIKITINAKPNKIHIIQPYLPTTDASDADVEEIYNVIEAVTQQIPSKEPLILMVDFNAKIGSTENDDHIRCVLSKHKLGVRNNRGEILIQFAVDNNFTVIKHHPRRLSTWISPNKQYKNQRF